MDFIRSIDFSSVLVVATLLFLPFLFYLVLNFMLVLEKMLLFVERILIRVFGEFVGKIFHFFAVIIIAICSAIREIFRFGRSKPVGRR